jgi:predicted component of type VI protein secretion system
VPENACIARKPRRVPTLFPKEGQMTKALILTAITGPQAGERHKLAARVNKVGSASSNDLVLHDRLIEPRHAEIRQVLERWFVVPLITDRPRVSLNGIELRTQSRLNAGDALTLGTVTYTVSLEETDEREVGAEQSAGNSSVPRLGEYFIRRGIMTADEVARAVQRQDELLRSGTRLPFGRVAYDMGFINRSQLDAALADQRGDFNDRFLD